MKSKLGTFGRALLIGLAGTALVATTLATNDVSACVKDRVDDTACNPAAGITIALGALRITVR